ALLRALATWSGLERLTGTARIEDEPVPDTVADPPPEPSEPAEPAPPAELPTALPAASGEKVEADASVDREGDDGEPVIDHRVLDQLAEETGKETMPMLVEVFVSDCRARIGRIDEATE